MVSSLALEAARFNSLGAAGAGPGREYLRRGRDCCHSLPAGPIPALFDLCLCCQQWVQVEAW